MLVDYEPDTDEERVRKRSLGESSSPSTIVHKRRAPGANEGFRLHHRVSARHSAHQHRRLIVRLNDHQHDLAFSLRAIAFFHRVSVSVNAHVLARDRLSDRLGVSLGTRRPIHTNTRGRGCSRTMSELEALCPESPADVG